MLTLTSSGFSITQNGHALAANFLAAIEEITVEDELNTPTTFSFKISMRNFSKDNWQGIDLDTFKLGDMIQISMGLSQIVPLMTGEIYALEPNFSNYSTLDIRGYDALYKLHFGTYTQVFTKMMDSDIAARIAEKIGLIPKVESTSIPIPYVLQNNQSNYAFLQERCVQLNYEMLVDNKQFIFRKSQENLTPTISLQFGETLTQLNLRLKVLTQNSQVKVAAWNPQGKALTFAQAENASSVGAMGGTQTGFHISTSISSSPVNIENLDIVDANQAKKIAQAQYDQALSQFIEGEGQCVGNTKVRSGKTVNLQGLGNKFSGFYYITSSTHTFDYKQGYRTSFKVRRTGV